MNTRVKEIRKTLGLTLEQFGEKVGVTKATISNIENGHREITKPLFISICREFNVNEDWLRTGEGEMFLQLDEDEEIAAMVGRVLANEDEFIKSVFITIAKNPEMLEMLKDFVEQVYSNMHKND